MVGAHAAANQTGDILGHERRRETQPGRGVATARHEDPVRQAAQVFDASLTLLDNVLDRDQRRNVSDHRQRARARALPPRSACRSRETAARES